MKNIEKINKDEFVEKEYNLGSIGLEDVILCFEKNNTYFVGPSFYIFFNNLETVIRKISEEEYALYEEKLVVLHITKEQYNIICEIFNSSNTNEM